LTFVYTLEAQYCAIVI